jgi:hypothetical protein
LDNCLVQLDAYSWGPILPPQHLSDPCPRTTCLAKLASHGLDVIVILREQAAEVMKHLNFVQHAPMHCELLVQCSANRTAMSCWLSCDVPARHSFVLMCAGYCGSACIPQRGHCGYLLSFLMTTKSRGCRSWKFLHIIHPLSSSPSHRGSRHLSVPHPSLTSYKKPACLLSSSLATTCCW